METFPVLQDNGNMRQDDCNSVLGHKYCAPNRADGLWQIPPLQKAKDQVH